MQFVFLPLNSGFFRFVSSSTWENRGLLLLLLKGPDITQKDNAEFTIEGVLEHLYRSSYQMEIDFNFNHTEGRIRTRYPITNTARSLETSRTTQNHTRYETVAETSNKLETAESPRHHPQRAGGRSWKSTLGFKTGLVRARNLTTLSDAHLRSCRCLHR